MFILDPNIIIIICIASTALNIAALFCNKNKKIHRNFRPYQGGYQPYKGKLDRNNPPKGGTGIPKK